MINNENLNDYNNNTINKCRLCLKYTDLQISLFGEYAIRNDILFKINKCLPNKILKNGSISMLCYKCLYSLEMNYDFWKKCHDTELIVNGGNHYHAEPTNQINILDSDDEEYVHCNYNLLPKGKPMDLCRNNGVASDFCHNNLNNWNNLDTNNHQMFQNVMKSLPAPQTTDQQYTYPNSSKILPLPAPSLTPSPIPSYNQQVFQNNENAMSKIKTLTSQQQVTLLSPSPIKTFSGQQQQMDTSDQASFSRLMHYFEQTYPSNENGLIVETQSGILTSSSEQQQQQQITKHTPQKLTADLLRLSPQKDLLDKFRFWKHPNNNNNNTTNSNNNNNNDNNI